MAVEQTLSIIKPDAVGRHLIGKIVAKFEAEGLRVVAMRLMQLTQAQAEQFYGIHRERPFFNDLVAFMISGPVLVQVLEGENAVQRNRDIMGATNPAEAEAGTLRAEYASSIDENAVHGSDSLENAAIEIDFFFDASDLCRYTR